MYFDFFITEIDTLRNNVRSFAGLKTTIFNTNCIQSISHKKVIKEFNNTLK